MKVTVYKLLMPRFGRPVGTQVYHFMKYDYGCANDDTRATGVEHISVSENPQGDYPFFTVPLPHLEKQP
jgi:hypothetical protein